MSVDFAHEMVIPNQDLPFKLFLFEGSDGNYRRTKHWHRSVEIFQVLEGELEFFINNQSVPLKAGEFVIVNSNEVHSIEAPVANKTVVVQIPITCFEGYLGADGRAVFAKRREQENASLAALIGEMYDIYQKKENAYELRVQSLFYELLYRLVTEFLVEEKSQGMIRKKRGLDRLGEITSYMKEYYGEPLSLESVAQRFGFSPTYLSRMFRQYADISYKTYLLDLRTEYAFREMMNTDHTLSQVAEHNGFPDSRALAKSFKKRYGTLPSLWRQKDKKVL